MIPPIDVQTTKKKKKKVGHIHEQNFIKLSSHKIFLRKDRKLYFS